MTKDNPTAVKALPLFTGDIDEVGNRFKRIGDRRYRTSLDCPLTPERAITLHDTLSESSVLRSAWKNVSGAPVVSFELEVTSFDNSLRPLATRLYLIPAEGEAIGSSFGIPLAGGATCGRMTVTRVEFADGLSWTRGSAPVYFTTDEKNDHDLEV